MSEEGGEKKGHHTNFQGRYPLNPWGWRLEIGMVSPFFVLAAVLLAPSGCLAGGGPENLVLVVNADSSDSVVIAEEYASLRQVPACNVIRLSGLPAEPTVAVADLRERILRPVLSAIEERGLTEQIDYVAYSAGFPFAVDVSEDMAGKRLPRVITQPASLTGCTYFHELVLAGDTEYLALDANWYARRLLNEKQDAPWTDADRELRAKLHPLLAQYQEARKQAEEAKTPLPPEALRLLDDAVASLQALVGNHPTSPELLYDLACVLALQGKPEDAMTALTAAYEAGWWNAPLTEGDSDLASLRERGDFKALLESMRGVVVESQPPRPFRSTTAWSRDGEPSASGEGRRYLLSAMLAYTGGPANTLDEALTCLRSSAAADGKAPAGTVYYMVSDDRARTGTRQGSFRSAAEALGELGVQAEVLPGVLPPDKPDVAGAMIGIASFSWGSVGATSCRGPSATT